ncbi:hypothetical protein CLV63_11467 [Murinocardiopsis flavida]|uniref:Uncharacterized protein n=1 Tax=Murinocardiopsis flavida TaxID=645275 RepID=A0A2P8DEH3_9ACTN|nr:hypothetical protein CLV63_11467 [Murinocardiopsis flavida]
MGAEVADGVRAEGAAAGSAAGPQRIQRSRGMEQYVRATRVAFRSAIAILPAGSTADARAEDRGSMAQSAHTHPTGQPGGT